jgi:hypothetical protein
MAKFLVIHMSNNTLYMYLIVTYRPFAKQRLCKHIPTEAYARSNRTSIARQRISKQAFSTMQKLCFLCGPCQDIIKVQKRSFEWIDVEFWRRQLKVVEKRLQEMI